MKTAEEILGESCYPHECGSMVEVVSKENALKAMEEYAAQFKEQECCHPYSSVLGDGEMQPAKCLACGKILSGDIPQEQQPLQEDELAEKIYDKWYAIMSKDQEKSNEPFNDQPYYINAMEEYASQKQGYPKEFVEWSIKNIGISGMSGKHFIIDYENEYNTIDEVYTFWKTNIKDK